VKVLVAVNGSSRAAVTVQFAAQFLNKAGEPPTIITVIDRKSERLSSQAVKILNQARELLGISDIQTSIRIGHALEEITREASQGNFDLLIMGEIQVHYLDHLLKRSTTARLAEGAPCPVIVVKGEPRPIRRILLCDSGARRSSVLSRFTAQLAEILVGEEEVTVLHVMSQISAGPGVLGEELRATVNQLIEAHTPEGKFLGRAVRVLEQSGIHPVPKVRHGLVVDEIINEARRGDYDLIVIGAHQIKKWHNFLLEDLTRKILLQSDRPVLVVK
jgi:nucleotide-binding universal stress UspA family protein